MLTYSDLSICPEPTVRWGRVYLDTAGLQWNLHCLGGRPTPFVETTQQYRLYHRQLRRGSCLVELPQFGPPQQVPTTRLDWCTKCHHFHSDGPKDRSPLLLLQTPLSLWTARLLEDFRRRSLSRASSPPPLPLFSHPGSTHTATSPLGEMAKSKRRPRSLSPARVAPGPPQQVARRLKVHHASNYGCSDHQSAQQQFHLGTSAMSDMGRTIPLALKLQCPHLKNGDQCWKWRLFDQLDLGFSSGRSKPPQLLCEGRHH